MLTQGSDFLISWPGTHAGCGQLTFLREENRIGKLPTWERVSARRLVREVYLNHTTNFYSGITVLSHSIFFFQLCPGILCGAFASVFMSDVGL